MSIKYKLVQRKNMSKDAEPDSKLYYAQTSSSDTVNFNSVCENISNISTASTGDVKLVLDGLIYEIKRALKAGQIVKLEGLGNFQATVGSKGVETQDEFNTSLMNTPKITFRASKDLKSALQDISYQKITEDTATDEGTGEDDNEDDGPQVQ